LESQFNRALESIWKFLSAINGFIVAKEPWKIRKEEGAAAPRLHRILSAAAEGIRLSAVMLSPFAPGTSRAIFATFAMEAKDPSPKAREGGGLPASRPMPEAPALFPRVDVAEYFERKAAPMTESPPNSSAGAASPAAPATDDRIGIEDFQKVRLKT